MDYSDRHEIQYTSSLSTSPVKSEINLSSFLFVCTIIILVLMGLITLYSASYDEALRIGRESSYFFMRQLVFALLGFISFKVISMVPLIFIKKATTPLLAISLLFMILTIFTPLGIEKGGAKRWLGLGPLPSFQPSELLKVAIILFIAHIISSSKNKKRALYVSLILIFISFLLIVAQKDYSTALVFMSVSLLVGIVGGLSFFLFASIALIFSIPALIFLLIEPYRIKRVVSFLFPSIDPTGMNYQVTKSLEAIKSGGLFGKGLGQGLYKLGIIPEVHSDFIFASFGEEMGLIGIIFLLLLLIFFTYMGLHIAIKEHSGDMFISLTSFGITMMIIVSAIINIAVVTSLLPPTGIPFPFFSQGGTNLFVIISECGLLYRCMKEQERRGESW